MAKQGNPAVPADDRNRWHDFSRLTSLGCGPLPGDDSAGSFNKRMLIGLSKPQCFLTRYPLAKAALQCLIFRHSLSSLTQAFFSSFDGFIPFCHRYPTSILAQGSICGVLL
jgi:hypothetical protein